MNEQLVNRQIPQSLLHLEGHEKQREPESEITTLIPDLSKVRNIMFEHYCTRGRRGLYLSENDFPEDQKKYYRSIISMSRSPGASAIASLMMLIELMKRKGVEGIERLKPGGKICEIGGPTSRSSQNDVVVSGAEKMVIVDPGHFDTSIAIEEVGRLDVEKHFEIAGVEDLSAIKTLYGVFDYVTSYRVFGAESRYGHDAYLGADLSTHEKRMKILMQIASVLKKGGVFLIEPNTVATIDATQFGFSEIQIDKMAEYYPDPSYLFRGNDRVHGFDYGEIIEAGFEPITQLPYNDVFVFQKK